MSICRILFIIFAGSTGIYAQNFILNAADSLFKYGNYYDSITEYKRYIFLKNNKIDSHVFKNTSQCYRAFGDFTNALDFIDKAIMYSESDSLRSERKIDKAIILLAKKQYSIAELVLVREFYFSKQENVKMRASLFLGFLYILNAQWEKAHSIFQNNKYYQININKGNLKKIEEKLIEAINTPLKKPEKAKLFSTFCAGAGQFYCGDVKNGINALSINGFLTFLTVNSILCKQYLNTLPYLYILKRYYSGNRIRAELTCKEYNNQNKKRNIDTLINVILKELALN